MEICTSNLTLNFDKESCESLEIEDIRRCLNMLYATKEGEQPLDREFGLNTDFLAEPIPVAQSKFALEVVKKTAKYEPRVTVQKVDYEVAESTGQLVPKIYLIKGA